MSNEDRVVIELDGVVGVSDIGPRPKDEDFIIAQRVITESGHHLEIAILLDGMGGGVAGEMASESAGSAFIEACAIIADDMEPSTSADERDTSWEMCVIAANRAVEQVANKEGGRSGTTLTGIILMRDEDGRIAWSDLVHVGDSRAYISRRGQATLLSEDHSMTGEMMRAGYIEIHEIEKTHGHNVLTMSLGGPDELEPMIKELNVVKGDMIILCCDGVWGPLHTETGLWLSEESDVKEMSKAMVAEALNRGSKDNCSILIWSI